MSSIGDEPLSRTPSAAAPCSAQRSVKREVLAHLGTLDFVAGKENVIFLGPPGTGSPHLATGLGIRACQAGHQVAFGTAAQ
ncbi:ATP-binding protein [Streptomyces bobili]|uniref:ATP-binding protein n=1 Tax=Streptomyces bobili TaxID=67280 RepID=UPI0037013764